MHDARWQEVKDVLDAVLDRPPEQWSAFLDQVCQDEEVRRRVDTLLAEEREDFLDRPAFTWRRQGDEDPSLQRVDGYRLLRRLGRGGMGEVFLAERAASDFHQQVAIKLVKRGMDTEEVVRRFRAERRILAGLEHPNVARLIDGGTTRDGLPYLVMEYVEGVPLDRYCREHKLSTRQRLELFLEICDAVQTAHRHLVVHRDLKPGNVLVSSQGRPKLLDFGIAKLLQSDSDGAATVTQAAGRMLTPVYASPEQVLGQPVTTASDIYSLGILLFETLTARLPFQRSARLPSAEELSREPPLPSVAVTSDEPASNGFKLHRSPAKLRGELAGDVDAIVCKALAFDPSQRYATVEQLSTDVRHHLGGRPVEARAPSWGYRALKLVRRRRKELMAGAGIFAAALAMAISLIVLMIERRDAAEQRRRFQLEAENNDRLRQFTIETLHAVDPQVNDGKVLGPEEILNLSVENATELFGDFPATEAAIVHGIASVFFGRGDRRRALELFEETLRLRRQAFDEPNWQVAEALNDVGFVRHSQGDYHGAERFYREVLDRPHFGPDGDPVMESLLMDNLAKSLRAQGKMAEAEAFQRQALAIRRRLYSGRGHRDVARSLHNLAILLRQTGHYDEAERHYREALAMHHRIGTSDYEIAATLANLGKLFCEQGRFEEGDKNLRESLARRRRIYGDMDHPQIAYSLREIGVCHQLRGELGKAEELYLSANDIFVQRDEESHPELGIGLRELASLRTERNELAAAEQAIRRALDVYRRRLAPDHWRIADAESVLGGCLLELGRVEEAAPLIERGYLGVRAVRGEPTREVREARKRFERLEALRSTPAG